MIDKLQSLITNLDLLAEQMSSPDVINDISQYTKLAKEHRRLVPLVQKSNTYIKLYQQIKEGEEILQGNDAELKEIVKEELSEHKENLVQLEEELCHYLEMSGLIPYHKVKLMYPK